VTWQFVLAGLLVGTLVGMTGMGGGSLMTPILILLFNFNPKVAVGTDILHGAIFKSLALWMLLGSAPLSLVGVQIASHFGEGAQDTMARIVGAALIAGGIGFALKTFLHGKPASDLPFLLQPRDRAIAVTLGAAGGFVVGLTSVGSGTFFGLVMLLVYPLTAQKIVGTDMTHAALLLWVAGTSHLLHGNVDLTAMGWLLLGSVPGVILGSRLSVRAPDRILRVGFAVVLFLGGIKIVEVPGADQIAVAGLALAVAGFAAWAIRRALRPTPALETE
jgi:uncharacterized membrane protein YfcA